MIILLLHVLLLLVLSFHLIQCYPHVTAFSSSYYQHRKRIVVSTSRKTSLSPSSSSIPFIINSSGSASSLSLSSSPNDAITSSTTTWNGDVVPNDNGKIRGCTITLISETEFSIHIDGLEADLGRFSEAIYKKWMNDAKQQRFQGFRPGTIPPHLEPTYRAYTMDECARETVLEAMQQNNIRPFDNTRNEIQMKQFSIPPPSSSNSNKTKKKTTKNKKSKKITTPTTAEITNDDDRTTDMINDNDIVSDTNSNNNWRTYSTMKEAIDIGGWSPGQSFSFIANQVKGQKLNNVQDGAKPLGLTY